MIHYQSNLITVLKVFNAANNKFKVAPSYCNADVVAFTEIVIPPQLIASPIYGGFCLSYSVIEHIYLYLYVLEFLFKYSNTLPFNLEHMYVLYHGTFFNQS